MSNFYQSRLKLRRAISHINDAEALINEYLEKGPILLSENKNGDYVNFEFTIIAEPAEMLPAVIGDAIHNLRTALDLLACDLVRRNGKNIKNVHFPFADKASNFEGAIALRKMNRAAPADLDILRSLKPYTGGNDLLRAIHDLDIEDKHTAIIPAVSYVSTGYMGFGAVAMGNTPRILGSGMYLIRPGQCHVDGTKAAEIKVVFGPNSPLADWEIILALWRMYDEVDNALSAFELT